MALIKCKECGKEISKKADSCPNCGFNLKKEKENLNQGIGCLVLIVLIILGWLWIDSIEVSEPEPWDQRDNSSMAYIMTRDWVTERLVSPSSAEFPGLLSRSEHTTKLSGQRYKIESYVDSQNRMGATIRTYFVAEVQQTAPDTWILISLEME